MEPKNRFQGMNSASLCRLAGRYDNPIPTWFLAPIDCLKILAQYTCRSIFHFGVIEFFESENEKIKIEEHTFPLRATGAWD